MTKITPLGVLFSMTPNEEQEEKKEEKEAAKTKA